MEELIGLGEEYPILSPGKETCLVEVFRDNRYVIFCDVYNTERLLSYDLLTSIWSEIVEDNRV